MSVAALLLLVACRGAPTDAVTWQEHWEVLGITDDGGVIDARAEVNNLGLLRGQGHMRFDRWRDDEAPVLYARDAAPGATEVNRGRDGVRVGTDTLGVGDQGAWFLRFASRDASATLRVTPRAGAPAPRPTTALVDHGQWTAEASLADGDLAGSVEAGPRGGILLGRAVVLHRGGDGVPEGPRLTALVFGAGWMVGLHEEAGERLLWGVAQGRALDLSGTTATRLDGGGVRLEGAALRGVVKLRQPAGATDPLAHLLPPERWALAALGQDRVRDVSRGFAEIKLEGARVSGPALVVVEAAP